MKRTSFLAILLTTLAFTSVFAQTKSINIIPQPKEYWWGGAVGLGSTMPFEKETKGFDLEYQNLNNQVVPLLISNKGRFLWADKPFKFQITEENSIEVTPNTKI